jgi:MazG family protein
MQIERLRQIVERLRAPDGCPWDREQTHESLKPHLLEECYELLDAIDTQDDGELKEELGDLLLQVVMHAQMASEQHRFTLDDVAEVTADKLVNRHPHVFGENRLPNSDAVLRQWDAIKRGEKHQRKSVLDGVPKNLPALAKAQKVQTKVARIGFDWQEARDVLSKIHEEIQEIDSASGKELADEIGDLLFAIVNFARKQKLDAEQLLSGATAKFSKRFQAMESLAEERNVDLSKLTLEQMDRLWEEVKAEE